MTEQPAAGIYRRWYIRKWGDRRFMALSPLLPSGQALYIYLLCGPQTASMPGVYVAGRAALAESLGWAPEAFAEAFAEVIGQGLAEFDEKHRLWFVPDAIEENYPASPNVVLSWRSQLGMLPDGLMRDRIIAALKARLYAGSEAFGKAFDEACGKPSMKPLPKASPAPSSNQRAENREQEGVPLPSALTPIPAKGGKEFLPSPRQLAEWADAFPRVDVGAQLLKMRVWSLANPTQRKTIAGMPKFVVGWLGRERPATSNGHAVLNADEQFRVGQP